MLFFRRCYMDKPLNAQTIAFDLFIDAVKRRDRNQFTYFDLYFNIAHCEDNLVKDSGEELTL